MSPTARSLLRLRRLGYIADPVERFVAGAGEHGQGIRRDWGHFGDILAASPRERRILLVQATSLGDLPSRHSKARGCPELALWLSAGGAFELHGWCKRRGRWAVKVIELAGPDLDANVLSRPPRRDRGRKRQADLFAGMQDVEAMPDRWGLIDGEEHKQGL